MIVEKILGNINERTKASELSVEKIFISLDESLKKILRLKSEQGNEFGLRLEKHSPNLQDGDIIFEDEKRVVILCIKPQKVIKIMPKSMQEMGEVAHSLGNRHLPIQMLENTILIEYDKLIEDELKRDGISFTCKDMKLKKAFKHLSHSH